MLKIAEFTMRYYYDDFGEEPVLEIQGKILEKFFITMMLENFL